MDVDRLAAAGIPVWVTEIDSLDDAFRSFRRLFGDVLEVEVPPWAVEAERGGRARPTGRPGSASWCPSGGIRGW